MKKIISFFLFFCLFRIYSATPTFTITTTTISIGYCQHQYLQEIKTVNGYGKINFSKTGGTLPSGLEVNSTTGLINGLIGTFNNNSYIFSVTAIDQQGHSASKTYTLTVQNLLIPDTNYVKYSTTVLLSQKNWWDYYDVVNNLFDKPQFTTGANITIAKPNYWYGNAPTYTVNVEPPTEIFAGQNITISGSRPDYTISASGGSGLNIQADNFVPNLISQTNVVVNLPLQLMNYIRIGSMFVVSGVVQIDNIPSNSGTSFSISMPIVSGADSPELNGTGVSYNYSGPETNTPTSWAIHGNGSGNAIFTSYGNTNPSQLISFVLFLSTQ